MHLMLFSPFMALRNVEELINLDEKNPIKNQPVSFRKPRPCEKAIDCFKLILDLILMAINAPLTDHGSFFY